MALCSSLLQDTWGPIYSSVYTIYNVFYTGYFTILKKFGRKSDSERQFIKGTLKYFL